MHRAPPNPVALRARVRPLRGKRRLDQTELNRLGVHQLRRFLEALLQRRYLENVPAIVPVLEREHRTAEGRLATSKKELDGLATDKLKVCCLWGPLRLCVFACGRPQPCDSNHAGWHCTSEHLTPHPGATTTGQGPHVPRGVPQQAIAAAARHGGGARRPLWGDARRRAHDGR
jgi:hypothetical protein